MSGKKLKLLRQKAKLILEYIKASGQEHIHTPSEEDLYKSFKKQSERKS